MSDSMQYNIGTITAHVLSDGYIEQELDPAESFPDVPSGDFKRVMEAYDIDTEVTRMDRNCLLIQTSDLNVLVDVGLGYRWNAELLENLGVAGIEPATIGHVILTHGHGDHTAGAVSEKGKLVFPNAQFWMWQTEWDFWSNPERYGPHKEYPENHPTLKTLRLIQDRVHLLNEEGEFLPGISAIQAPGHTMGHMALLISDGDEKLLAMIDTFLYDFQVEHIDWCTPFDRYPEIAIKSRTKILEMAEREETPLLAYHFAFPGIGQAVRQGSTWRWEALF